MSRSVAVPAPAAVGLLEFEQALDAARDAAGQLLLEFGVLHLELLEDLRHLDRREESAHGLLDAAIRVFDEVV